MGEAVRFAWLSLPWMALGCSAPDPYSAAPLALDGGGLPDVADAPVSPGDDDAGDASPALALTWTAVSANIVEGDIVSVWGTSSNDIYVGTDQKSVYRLKSGVSSWTGLPSDVAGGGWGSDPDNVYAVGASAWLAQMNVASGGGLFKYAGDGLWTSAASGTFYSVWGSSSSDVYAAGDTGVLHAVDGGPFVSESSAGANVLALWGTGPADVYAGTSGTRGAVLHSEGDGNWQSIYAPSPDEAWAGWSGGAGNVYAILTTVGTKDPPSRVVHSTAHGGWVDEYVDQTPTTLVALWGSGADVYAGGWHADSAGRGGDLFHSTGDGQWARVPLPGNLYDVRCIWGSSATDVYVGAYDVDQGAVLLHGQP